MSWRGLYLFGKKIQTKKSIKIPPKQCQPGNHTIHFSFQIHLSLLVALFKQMQWHHFYSSLHESESKLISNCIFQTCTMANNSGFKQPNPPNVQKPENCAKSIKSIVFAQNRISSRCSLNPFLAHIGSLYATKQKHSTPRQQYL